MLVMYKDKLVQVEFDQDFSDKVVVVGATYIETGLEVAKEEFDEVEQEVSKEIVKQYLWMFKPLVKE